MKIENQDIPVIMETAVRFREVGPGSWPTVPPERVMRIPPLTQFKHDDFEVNVAPFSGGLVISETKSLIWYVFSLAHRKSPFVECESIILSNN